MKKLLVLLAVVLLAVVVWAGEGSPWPLCQPSLCDPNVVSCIKYSANIIRRIEGKQPLPYCSVSSNRPKC